ncbi:hypothetical protein [Bacillus solitudinis]|uniref:hypothetical protein n=1 Tax=Bacillus solitudinis TaxID=2014074 RepID=UPI000C2498EB|nr:hypothetical protein [Bacillus solitudinis]
MMLSVYYDEIDGGFYPQWMLLPADTGEEYANYSIEAPFERFWPEDFHDSMTVVTVTQASLVRDPFNEKNFSVHIPSVVDDLTKNGGNMEHINDSQYFLVRFDDLEELLQMNVRRFYLS